MSFLFYLSVFSLFSASFLIQVDFPLPGEEVLVDSPQMSIVKASDGKQYQLLVMRLTKEELLGQDSLSAKKLSKWLARRGGIQKITLDNGKIFILNPKTKQYEPQGENNKKSFDDPRNKPSAPGVSPTEQKTTTVIAEGLGKDEKEARKAAFRDAVSKVVGSLVDSETLVKNDEVISERILEFSGGFIKTYDVIKSEKAPGDLIRVRIKAVVERMQIVSRLMDMKVTTREVKGSDLLAEKMTKEEARKNATLLLTKLYSDIPKIIQAEVQNKPKLSEDGKGVDLAIVVSADMKAYWEFTKKATSLLDKVAIEKDSGFFNLSSPFPLSTPRIPNPNPFSFPYIQKTQPGYSVWLLTSSDPTGMRTRWNYYWVDADSSETVQPLAGEISLQLMFLDEKGKRITEEVVNLEELSQPLPNPFHIRPIVKNHNEIWQSMYYDWFMYSVFSTKIPIDPGFSRRGMIFPTETEDRITSLCIAPLIIHVDFTINRQIVHSPRCNFQLHLKHKVNLADSQLEAIKQIKVGVELLNKPKTKP